MMLSLEQIDHFFISLIAMPVFWMCYLAVGAILAHFEVARLKKTDSYKLSDRKRIMLIVAGTVTTLCYPAVVLAVAAAPVVAIIFAFSYIYDHFGIHASRQ